MRSIRFACLVVSLLVVALAVGCSSGTDTPEPTEETAADSAPAPEPESAPAPAPRADGEEFEEESEEDNPGFLYPVVELMTNLGPIRIELYPDKAPKTVDNFLSYVQDGFYNGTVFHRVMPGFVIQGGGFTADMTKKETRPPIENEADNGVRNLRGTICMARTNDPHSATSQFFINTVDNPRLDFRDRRTNWGYAVFGKVVLGLEIVDQIEKVPTTSVDRYRNVPADPVTIETARLIG